MGKALKSRTTIGILSILFALFISFGITPLLNKAMKSQVEIIRATKNIAKGEEITADKVTKIKVGNYNLPQGVIKDTDEIIGKYATTDIYKDDFFLSSKLSMTKGKENNYLYDVEKEEEYLAVSVTVKTLAAGLSEKIKEGDIVSIVSSLDQEDPVIIVPELRYVEVLAVTTKEGQDIEEETEELSATVTLSVTGKQAEKLVEHEQRGEIHFALVHRGDRYVANQYIDTQKDYLESLLSLEIEGEELNEGTDDITDELGNTNDLINEDDEGGIEEDGEEKESNESTETTNADGGLQDTEIADDGVGGTN